MPGLTLFKRQWGFSGDDFVFSSGIEVATRSSWLLTLAIIFGIHHNGFDCEGGYHLKHVYIGSMVFNFVILVNCLILMRTSSRGTIKNPHPRKNIHRWLYIKVALFLPELAWTSLSSYWLFGNSYSCMDIIVLTARVAVFFSWALFLSVLFWFVMFLLTGSSKRGNSNLACRMEGKKSTTFISSASNIKVWEHRFRCLCCCISGRRDTQDAFSDVAKLVAEFFYDLDLVPSDIAAGLVLVHQNQSVELTSVTADGHHASTLTSSPSPPVDWMTISNMQRYMRYAMGSYGWPLFMFDHMLTGLCRLCTKCRCCSACRCKRSPSPEIHKDNCFHCHTAAIKKTLGVYDEDLVYCTFHDKYKEIPFFVALDRQKKTVVVSIRGTLSFRDALTDLNARGSPLDIDGVTDSYCHSAMLEAANYIKQELTSHNLIKKGFNGLGVKPIDGSLVITGHSLGAGVAAILAVLLRGDYPSLRCYAFSPPGGLLSANASRYTRQFVVSVVVGKDLVARLGMANLAHLKVQLLRDLIACNWPKYQILGRGCLRMVCGKNRERTTARLIREAYGRKYISDASPILQDRFLLKDLEKAESHLESVKTAAHWPQHPPGHILHVIQDESPSCCGSSPKYRASWTGPKAFARIHLSHSMLTDHLPTTVFSALCQLADDESQPGMVVDV